MPEVGENGRTVIGLFFNSDRTKDKLVYRISWERFRRIIHDLAADDIVEMSFDRRSGKIIKRGPPTAGPATP